MAQIKIEKKVPVWPWIAAALLIAGLLVYFFVIPDDNDRDPLAGEDENDTERNISPATEATYGSDGDAVAAYVQYVDAGKKMGLDHEYTNGALSRLTAAVRAKAGQLNFDVSADLLQVEQNAQQIQQDPFESTHADKIRSAAVILARTMGNMQQQHYPDLKTDAEAVEQASTSIDPTILTLEQRDAVKNFFERSASLLLSMK